MHDVIIIGAGAAGLSAALWCDELGLDALVLEQAAEVGGQLLRVYNRVGNHLGVEAEDGRALRDRFAAQVEEKGFDLWTEVEIESVDLRAKVVRLRSGEELRSIGLIIATGVRRRRLGVPGEEEFAGRGVLESGKRDAAEVAGHDVLVVGGGDAAAENALLLAEVCPTVTLVHRGKRLGARREFVEKIQGEHCITVFTEATLQRIMGAERVESVEILTRGRAQAVPHGRARRAGARRRRAEHGACHGATARGRARLRRHRAASRRRASRTSSPSATCRTRSRRPSAAPSARAPPPRKF